MVNRNLLLRSFHSIYSICIYSWAIFLYLFCCAVLSKRRETRSDSSQEEKDERTKRKAMEQTVAIIHAFLYGLLYFCLLRNVREDHQLWDLFSQHKCSAFHCIDRHCATIPICRFLFNSLFSFSWKDLYTSYVYGHSFCVESRTEKKKIQNWGEGISKVWKLLQKIQIKCGKNTERHKRNYIWGMFRPEAFAFIIWIVINSTWKNAVVEVNNNERVFSSLHANWGFLGKRNRLDFNEREISALRTNIFAFQTLRRRDFLKGFLCSHFVSSLTKSYFHCMIPERLIALFVCLHERARMQPNSISCPSINCHLRWSTCKHLLLKHKFPALKRAENFPTHLFCSPSVSIICDYFKELWSTHERIQFLCRLSNRTFAEMNWRWDRKDLKV